MAEPSTDEEKLEIERELLDIMAARFTSGMSTAENDIWLREWAGDSFFKNLLLDIVHILPSGVAEWFAEHPEIDRDPLYDDSGYILVNGQMVPEGMPEELHEEFLNWYETMFLAGGSMVGSIDWTAYNSVSAAGQALLDAGFDQKFVKRFVSEATAKSKFFDLPSALDEAYKSVAKSAPGAGITPQALKNLKFMHPTAAKVGKAVLGVTGVGTGLIGVKGIQEAAFGGFMFEEAEQMTMFAQFFSSDDLQNLARTIANTSLPVWDLAELWADSVGRPVKGLTSSLLGEGVGGSIFAGPALGTHESFTRTLIDKLTILEEKGAWIGLIADPVTGEVTEWGRPASQPEIASFLKANPQYYQDYKQEMTKLARENPALLYQLYYEGMADWYTDLPTWMREQIDEYKQRLKDWEYQASRGELTGQDALNMAESLSGALWYGQKDKTIIQDAIRAGNLIKTMIEKGEISEAKGNFFLTGLETKLKNNEVAARLITKDENGRIVWKILSDAELKQNYGSLTIIADKPELIFSPPGSTFQSESLTPYTSGVKEDIPEQIEVAIKQLPDMLQEVASQGGTVIPSEENLRQVDELKKRLESDFAKRFGISFEEYEKAKGTIPAHEEYQKSQALWQKIVQGGIKKDQVGEDELNRLISEKWLTPEQVEEFKKTGKVEIVKGPTEFTPVEGGRGRSKEDTETTGKKAPSQRPAEGYTKEMLSEMLASTDPEKRATAKKQLEILQKREAEPKETGAYGYERTEIREKPLTEEEAFMKTSKITAGTEISEDALMEIYNYLKTEGASPTKAISADLSDEAKKAVFGSLGITEYKPMEEGYGTTYGVGRRTTGR